MNGRDLVEAPELFSVGTQSLVDRSDSLGLVWGLKPATINTVTSTEVTATYDGDTVAIGVIPLVSGLFVGARVVVIRVPPSGNYVIGFMNSGNGVAYLGANISTQGTVVTTAAAETAVPSAAWDSEPTFRFPAGGVFEFHVAGGYLQTADQQVIQVAIRVGQASTSGTFLWAARAQAAQLLISTTFDFIGYACNRGTEFADFLSLTITKVAGGAGNVSLLGAANVSPLVLRVAQIGTLDSLPSLATDLISVN